MKVLVTGGCGFLGSNIASSYLADGALVIVLDSLSRRGSVANLQWLQRRSESGHFHFHQIDVANSQQLHALFRLYGHFDYVCHFAGQVAMTSSLTDPSLDFNTNLVGTFNMLEAVRAFSPDALFAFSSTNKVYGDLEWITTDETLTRYILPHYPLGLDESIPLDFSTPYGCSKGAADQYVRDWARVYGLKTVIFRHSSIYGGRQFPSSDQGWIGWFCQQALHQKYCHSQGIEILPFTISGTGKQVRDVLHADDLVHLYRRAYECKDTMLGEIFNIGGGVENSLSLLELFALLSHLLDIPPLAFQKTTRRTSDQDCFVASISKAKELLSWSPIISKTTGISRMIDWCQEALIA